VRGACACERERKRERERKKNAGRRERERESERESETAREREKCTLLWHMRKVKKKSFLKGLWYHSLYTLATVLKELVFDLQLNLLPPRQFIKRSLLHSKDCTKIRI